MPSGALLLVVCFCVLFVLWYLARVYSPIARHRPEVAGYGRRLDRGIQDHWVVGIIIKRPNELGSAQVIKLIAVGDTPGQPHGNLGAPLMLQVDSRVGLQGIEGPVSPLEQDKSEFRVADHIIAAGCPLLFKKCATVIGENEERKKFKPVLLVFFGCCLLIGSVISVNYALRKTSLHLEGFIGDVKFFGAVFFAFALFVAGGLMIFVFFCQG